MPVIFLISALVTLRNRFHHLHVYSKIKGVHALPEGIAEDGAFVFLRYVTPGVYPPLDHLSCATKELYANRMLPDEIALHIPVQYPRSVNSIKCLFDMRMRLLHLIVVVIARLQASRPCVCNRRRASVFTKSGPRLVHALVICVSN